MSDSRILPTNESQAGSLNIMSQSVDMEIEGKQQNPEPTSGTSKNKRKMKPRSKAWNYFEKVKCPISGTNSFIEKAQCIFCKAELNASNKSNGISALIYHANNCKKNPAKAQQTVLTYVPSDSARDGSSTSGMLKTWTFDQDSVRKALAYMIILDEQPFRFVECPSF
uniref:BED-type domain-containing protein n=1 Tax=Kalanchoe fedtschenkoi TaxID=63787 RepID=A0A7N0VDS4_KALFE